MKRLFLFVSFLVLFPLFLFTNYSHATVYEASTLHNAVSRSDSVQGLFHKRWEDIVEKNLYWDLYAKINWLNGFQVNAYNRGTKENEVSEMTLVRTYGSFTVNYPILMDNYLDELGSRFDFNKKEEETAEPDVVEGGEEEEESFLASLWEPDNLLIGFTTTGFHYGLTRKTTVDRGDAGEETVTDYKYSQFFDDIYALSFLYVPYFYIHGGLIVSNQIEPDDDGTIDYGDSSNRSIRYFFSSNILSFLNTNATISEREFEVFAFSLNINQTIKFIYEVPKIIPEVTIGYKQINLYNDEAYDPVWVSTFYIPNISAYKDGGISDDDKDEAQLKLYTLLLENDFFNMFFPSFYMEFQRTDKVLIDKRDLKKIDVELIKTMRAMLGFNVLALFDISHHYIMLSGGWSRYWDPAVAVHRESGDGYSVDGWIFKFEYSMPLFGIYFMVNRNYSQELRRLIEATDKLALEGSLYIRI